MGFFKKKELTEEEKLKLQLEQEEKEKIRCQKADQRAVENEIRKQERAAEKAETEFWFGPNPSFEDQMNKGIYSFSIDRVRRLLSLNETILGSIPVEYDMPGGKEVKGLLVATDQKLVFCSNTISKEFTELMDYKSMSSISIQKDGFLKKEIHVVSGREKRIFDDIKDNPQLQRFLKGVQKQISQAHAGTPAQPKSDIVEQRDRVQQLKELAELKNTGILTEEEFQTEKQKILSN